ncbi:MAG: B12-binding domain-containing radical SAM protein [Candidatus Coatesbacteria bacterium]|nr:B12-binding domain-containing radical SAM protein [Candidatus Coatesbacteria bacterium]
MIMTLIEISCPDTRAYGVRSLSAYLRAKNKKVKIIFLPPHLEKLRSKSGDVILYSDEVIEDVLKITEDSDIVGISVLTYYYDKAIQLSNALKKAGKIVVWGGIHATTRPEDALKVADLVIAGEAEDTLLELYERIENGETWHGVKNLRYIKDGDLVMEPIRPLIQDLDSLPYIDHDYLQVHFVLDGHTGHIEPMTEERLKEIMSVGPLLPLGRFYHYQTMASRGCPHNCAYCCNNIYRGMYSNQKYLRWRSWDHLFGELRDALKKMPFLNTISFFDDSFFSQPTEVIQKFAERYKKEVGLPFATQSSPQTTNEEKMKALVEAGMVYIEMGIQTGSPRISEIYHRQYSKENVISATNAIAKFKNYMLTPDYHLILDNPWERTEDVILTLKLMLDVPKPFSLKPASLILYPGTGVYKKAISENMVNDEYKEIYRKAFSAPYPTYLNFLIYLSSFNALPRFIIRLLANPLFIIIFQRKPFAPLFAVLRYFVDKGILVGRMFLRMIGLQKQGFSELMLKGFAERFKDVLDLDTMERKNKES